MAVGRTASRRVEMHCRQDVALAMKPSDTPRGAESSEPVTRSAEPRLNLSFVHRKSVSRLFDQNRVAVCCSTSHLHLHLHPPSLDQTCSSSACSARPPSSDRPRPLQPPRASWRPPRQRTATRPARPPSTRRSSPLWGRLRGRRSGRGGGYSRGAR